MPEAATPEEQEALLEARPRDHSFIHREPFYLPHIECHQTQFLALRASDLKKEKTRSKL